MGYYDLAADERKNIYSKMETEITMAFKSNRVSVLFKYFSDADTYIRRNCALITGRLYSGQPELKQNIPGCMKTLTRDENEKVRQTAAACLGEMGRTDGAALDILGKLLGDPVSSVRNAVVGALKRIGEKNPAPALAFAKRHMQDPNPAIRREMAHGIELRGRTHPEEVLPLLAAIQFDQSRDVQKMLIHVIGQVSYKKGCLPVVLGALAKWENKDLAQNALVEIVKTHISYQKFSDISPADAEKMIRRAFPDFSGGK